MSLHQLGKKYGTDKTDYYKYFKQDSISSYLTIYEKYFEKIRYDVRVFVEIGIKLHY